MAHVQDDIGHRDETKDFMNVPRDRAVVFHNPDARVFYRVLRKPTWDHQTFAMLSHFAAHKPGMVARVYGRKPNLLRTVLDGGFYSDWINPAHMQVKCDSAKDINVRHGLGGRHRMRGRRKIMGFDYQRAHSCGPGR